MILPDVNADFVKRRRNKVAMSAANRGEKKPYALVDGAAYLLR